MESAFSDITEMFTSGARIIVKMLFLYIILPEVVAIIVIGGVLRIRGKLFRILCTGVALLGLYLFATYGLPQMTEEATALTK